MSAESFASLTVAAPSRLSHCRSMGSVREMASDPRRDGFLLKLEGWTQSPQILEVTNQGIHDTRLLPPAHADFGNFAVTRLLVPSHDGVQVPLTVLARKGVALDGSNPTILTGYGAYGFASEPRFDPKLLAWLERGGIYAVAHVRGGGEYGEEWHKAGQILTKSNTILDFVACADYLVDRGYARPAKLAGTGSSAGGITSVARSLNGPSFLPRPSTMWVKPTCCVLNCSRPAPPMCPSSGP